MLPRTLRTLGISASVLLALISFGAAARSQSHVEDIGSIDFKNFSYPWIYPNSWPDGLQWMSLRLQDHIELINGTWDERDESERTQGLPFHGLTLEDVGFGQFSRMSERSAIVVLRYDSGGTQSHYWIYIYGLSGRSPKLMAFLHTGDRAYYGLYRVFEKGRILNIELFDPDHRQGDCCSTGYIRYQFRWNGQGFESVGSSTKGKVDSVSRRAVSVFGLPIDSSNSH